MTDSLAPVERLLLSGDRVYVKCGASDVQGEAVRLLLDVARASERYRLGEKRGSADVVRASLAVWQFARSLGGDPQ